MSSGEELRASEDALFDDGHHSSEDSDYEPCSEEEVVRSDEADPTPAPTPPSSPLIAEEEAAATMEESLDEAAVIAETLNEVYDDLLEALADQGLKVIEGSNAFVNFCSWVLKHCEECEDTEEDEEEEESAPAVVVEIDD